MSELYSDLLVAIFAFSSALASVLMFINAWRAKAPFLKVVWLVLFLVALISTITLLFALLAAITC